jgi:2-dehydropantoate 2-reductase
MRFVIFGAGAIGGVIGGRLFEAGHEVVLIARGAHLAAIQADGLTVEDPERSVTLPIPAASGPAELELTAEDAVLLAVKGQDTAGAVRALALAAPPEMAVVCAQNGVDNERTVLRSFANTYGMNVQCPTAHIDPGVVQATSSPVTGMLDIGRYPEGVDDGARRVASALAGSTFLSEPRADIMRWKRRKLLMNLGNSVQALTRPSERAGAVYAQAITEGEACFAAAGLEVTSAEDDKERRADHLQEGPIHGERRGGGSTWQSLARGTGSVEADHLNGEIVLLGRLQGVPTPANALLQHLANQAAAEGWPPGEGDADELFASLPS